MAEIYVNGKCYHVTHNRLEKDHNFNNKYDFTKNAHYVLICCLKHLKKCERYKPKGVLTMVKLFKRIFRKNNVKLSDEVRYYKSIACYNMEGV